MIIDLESTSSADFLTEASSWGISNQACSSCNKTFTIPPNSCSIPQETIFAGPNILRYISNLNANIAYGYLGRSYTISYLSRPMAMEFDFWAFYNAIEDNPSSLDISNILRPSGLTPLQISKTLEGSCTMDFSVASQGVLVKSFFKFHVQVLMNHQESSYLGIEFVSRSILPPTLISYGLKNFKVYMNSGILANNSIVSTNFPCQINEYWDGSACTSCHAYCSVCSGPTEDQCSACRTGYYNYQNGPCLKTCQSPRKIQNGTLCMPPCSSHEDFYYEADQACKPTCDSPYEPEIIDTIKICSLSAELTIEEVQAVQSFVASQTSQRKATGAAMKATTALSSSNPSLSLLAGQASMLFYIRYIDVNYPGRLSLVLALQDSSPFSFSFGLHMPKALDRELKKRSLPKIFERYKLHSNFLHNSWDILSSLMIALLLVLVVAILRSLMRKCWIFEALLQALKWNIPLMVICSAFGDFFFYSSLQFHAGLSGSIWEVLSLIFAIIMMVTGITIALMIGRIVNEILRNKEKGEKKWKNFGLLFKNYKRTSLFTFGYMGLFMLESIVFNLIIANLYSYPLLEILLITVFGLLMFFYLVFQAPLKQHLELAQLLWNKLLLLIVNMCVLILAIMDELQITEHHSLRDNIGETIIVIFSIFSISSIVFMALGILLAGFFLYKLLKKLRAQGQPLTPLRILEALLKKEGHPELKDKAKTMDSSLSMVLPNQPRKRRIKRPDMKKKDQTASTMKPTDNINSSFNTSAQDLNDSGQMIFESFDFRNPSGGNLGHSGVLIRNLRRKPDQKKIGFRRDQRLDFESNNSRTLNSNHVSSQISQDLFQFQGRRNYIQRVKTLQPLMR